MNSPYKGKFRVSQQFKGSDHDGLDLVGVDSTCLYSTVDGTVERAGWENPSDHKQGFGLYVRIKQTGTADRYYFGHMSELNVNLGDTVKAGQKIGLQGSTGNSTGPHCHYCVRADASKAKIKDVSLISGIPNEIGTYNDSGPKEDGGKTLEQLAKEVIAGKWGNGDERKKRLAAAGYDYSGVQSLVNQMLKPQNSAEVKTDVQLAKEVIAGKWGNGEERKKRLAAAGYDYSSVQSIVNKIMAGENYE